MKVRMPSLFISYLLQLDYNMFMKSQSIKLVTSLRERLKQMLVSSHILSSVQKLCGYLFLVYIPFFLLFIVDLHHFGVYCWVTHYLEILWAEKLHWRLLLFKQLVDRTNIHTGRLEYWSCRASRVYLSWRCNSCTWRQAFC